MNEHLAPPNTIKSAYQHPKYVVYDCIHNGMYLCFDKEHVEEIVRMLKYDFIIIPTKNTRLLSIEELNEYEEDDYD